MSWRLSDRTLSLEQPLAAGIVNVTDDSMFEGARSGTPERAVEDGVRLAEAGFEMLDVGAVAARTGLPISADTYSAEVARRGLEAGAVAINDIAGGSEAMLELAAETGCGLVVMQIEGPPREDREPPRHDDPVNHLKRWFTARLESATRLGVDEDLEILRRLGELKVLGRPLYISLSRKDFLGAVLAGSWEERLPPSDREWATAAAVALAVT